MSLTTISAIPASAYQISYISQIGNNGTFFYSENGYPFQVKTPAYIFGERIVKPLLDNIPSLCSYIGGGLRKYVTLIDRAFTFPVAEARQLPPNALDPIKDAIEGMGDVILTRDMVDRIVTDNAQVCQNEPGLCDLDPEIVKKIKSAFVKVQSIAGIIVNPTDFTTYFIDEFESKIKEKIDNIDKTKRDYESQFDKPRVPEKSEKNVLWDDYTNQLEQKAALLDKKIKIYESMESQMKVLLEKSKELGEDIDKKTATANGIYNEAKPYGPKIQDLGQQYDELETKYKVGKKLEQSLVEGIEEHQKIVDSYKHKNFNKLSNTEQDRVTYSKKRVLDQQAMLQDVQPRLVVDKQNLDSYLAEKKNIDDTVGRLSQYLEETTKTRDSLTRQKEAVDRAFEDLLRQHKSAIDEAGSILEEYEKIRLLRDNLI